MTQDEIIEMYMQVSKELCNDTEWCWAGVGEPLQMFAKLAVAKALAQEPRNVRERWNVEFDGNDLLVCFNDHEKGDKCQYERYSPQRTWVGLTDEEIWQIATDSTIGGDLHADKFAKAIESKLKELNG